MQLLIDKRQAALFGLTAEDISLENIRVRFAGPYGNAVIGETIWDTLQPLIKKYEPYLTFLGTLNSAQMADFYAVCDVITVASINNTESFGH